MIPRRVVERIIVEPNGCLTYGERDNGYGYRQIWLPDERRRVVAHRYFYEYWKGPVPVGMDLDHLCRNRACINADHLEPVPRGENIRRGLHGVLKTHCKYGHPWIPENWRVQWNRKKGESRICGLCYPKKGRPWN